MTMNQFDSVIKGPETQENSAIYPKNQPTVKTTTFSARVHTESWEEKAVKFEN